MSGAGIHVVSYNAFEHGHAHGHAVFHLIENHRPLKVGDFGRKLAAAVDGAGMHDHGVRFGQRHVLQAQPVELEIFARRERRIVLPLAGPGTAAVAIFSFLFSYNEFFVASVFLRDDSAMTVPVGVQMFMQQYATDWGSLMAAATATMVPAFIFFMFVQKYMAYGGVEGGVKG